MSNFQTVTSITDNLQSVLKGMGINFTREAYDDEAAIPATILPHGQIFYEGETFEYTHGQKPEYGEILFRLRVVLRERASTDAIREQMKWVHLIRDGLTINALNIGDLVTSKLVSRVTTEGVEIVNNAPRASIIYRALIRYREL